jgi:hypothetical protein
MHHFMCLAWLPHGAWSLSLIPWWIAIASILGSAGLVKLWAITSQCVGNLSLTYTLTMCVWSILCSHEVHVHTMMACNSIVNKPTTSMHSFLIRRNMWLHDALTMLLHSANNIDLNSKHSTIVLCFHSDYFQKWHYITIFDDISQKRVVTSPDF